MLKLEFYRLEDDGTWSHATNGCILTADNIECAWHFGRRMLGKTGGSASIFHILDPQKSALTAAKFAAIIAEFGGRRPVVFGSVDNPKLVMEVEASYEGPDRKNI